MNKAKIYQAPARELFPSVKRGQFYVECPCGYLSLFDAFAWGGHTAMRCHNRKCRLFIAQSGMVGKTKHEAIYGVESEAKG